MVHHAKVKTLSDGCLCLFIPTQDGIDRLFLNEIVYLKGMRNRTGIVLIDGRTLILLRSLMYWAEDLLSHGFARPNRSYVFNLSYYKHYQRGRGGYVDLSAKDYKITVSRRFRKLFLKALREEIDLNPPVPPQSPVPPVG